MIILSILNIYKISNIKFLYDIIHRSILYFIARKYLHKKANI